MHDPPTFSLIQWDYGAEGSPAIAVAGATRYSAPRVGASVCLEATRGWRCGAERKHFARFPGTIANPNLLSGRGIGVREQTVVARHPTSTPGPPSSHSRSTESTDPGA